LDILKNIARRAMIEHDLLPDFSSAAVRELAAMPRSNTEPTPEIRDLRARLWCSIDNDDSRDLDQLSVAEPLPGGSVKILVAIADVDSRVAPRSAIDDHARSNTTSVYTAAQIFPMLPEGLSTDLTSLNPGEERLAIVIEMTVDRDGAIVASDLYRANVFNHAKLAYNSLSAWLDGAGPAPERLSAVAGLDEQLRIQDQVAQSLRRVRRAHGALNLETVEARPVFKDEALTDLRADEQNRAKDLIEDFMVSANGVVARFLDARGRASIRRVLRSPERWTRIAALAKQNGGELPAEPDALALNQFLSARREADPKGFADLSLSVIKLLGAGEYAVELPNQKTPGHFKTLGHFGLAVRDYTHSTAPNRRFPDLLTQRLLKAALRGDASPYSAEELQAMATRCNEQERQAAKVERQVRKAATALLLASHVGQRFAGIVTGASPKGTWVRVEHPLAEGKIVRNYAGLDVGDRVTVQLLGVEPERGFIDFARVG
jgi:exoribonuclease-2